MMLYSVVPKVHSRDLSGKGAQLFGGRWNPKGTAVLYVAESSSQALLEYLPHFPETSMPPDLMLVSIDAPDSLSIKEIDKKDLPADWNSLPPPVSTVEIGRKWLLDRVTAALRVPSVMLPYGKAWNLVLNPEHTEFARIRVVETVPLSIDSRLSDKLIDKAK